MGSDGCVLECGVVCVVGVSRCLCSGSVLVVFVELTGFIRKTDSRKITHLISNGFMIISFILIMYLMVLFLTKFTRNPKGTDISDQSIEIDFDLTVCSSHYITEPLHQSEYILYGLSCDTSQQKAKKVIAQTNQSIYMIWHHIM